MSPKIAFKKSIACDLKKTDKAQADKILEKIEKDLPEKADRFPALTGKLAGLRKFRVGDYRIIFTILEDTALILRIRQRRENYR